MEDDRKPGALAAYFGRMDRTLGNYKSYDVIETKKIGQTSQIIYLSLNFDRAAVYGRFLLYRTEKGWSGAKYGFQHQARSSDAVARFRGKQL